MDLHKEAGKKKNKQTLANLASTSKNEVDLEKFLQEQKSKNTFLSCLVI